MTRPATAPAYIEVPLPLECTGCRHPWPTACTCEHPTVCRVCLHDLTQPATAAGYCSITCFHQGEPGRGDATSSA